MKRQLIQGFDRLPLQHLIQVRHLHPLAFNDGTPLP